eukprot:jgi/Galph1/3264/GphlegSOOS_G1924.1
MRLFRTSWFAGRWINNTTRNCSYSTTIHTLGNQTRAGESLSFLVGADYVSCVRELAEAFPLVDKKSVKLVESSRNFVSLCERRTFLLSKLRQVLLDTSVNSNTSLEGNNKLWKMTIDKLGHELAENMLRLSLSQRKPFVTMLLADFPVTNSIYRRMSLRSPSKTNNACMDKNSSTVDNLSSDQDNIHADTLVPLDDGKSIFYGRAFYDSLLESMVLHPKGVVATYKLRETLECLLQPSIESPAFLYFGESGYDWELFKDSLESFLQQIILYADLYYRSCFLQVGCIDQSNYRHLFRWYQKSLEISTCFASESAKQFPSYPLAFADVVITSRIPASAKEMVDLQLDWNELGQQGKKKEPYCVILSECVPCSEKHIRSGFHHSLFELVFKEYLPQQLSGMSFYIYSLSHISGFVPWLYFQYEIARGLRPQHVSVIPSHAVELIETVIREIQGSGEARKTSLEQIDTQVLEKAKEMLLSLCAYYLLHVRRRNGLPVDPNCAFHVINGAKLIDLQWAADTGMKTMTEGAHMMSLFCYHLKDLQHISYHFSTTQNILKSHKIDNLLQSTMI